MFQHWWDLLLMNTSDYHVFVSHTRKTILRYTSYFVVDTIHEQFLEYVGKLD